MEDVKECWFTKICRQRQADPSFCENNFCVLKHKMSYLCEASLLQPKDWYPVALYPDADGTDVDKFTQLKGIQQSIQSFVKEGKNLLIYSKITGNGKSAFAKKMLLSWLSTVVSSSPYECRGLFISVPKFLNELKSSISHPSEYASYIKSVVEKVDLIVWDEIGVKDITPWEHDQLFSMINDRVEAGKANIYTSNMLPGELRTRLGDRLYSRVVNISTGVELMGKDKRGLLR